MLFWVKSKQEVCDVKKLRACQQNCMVDLAISPVNDSYFEQWH